MGVGSIPTSSTNWSRVVESGVLRDSGAELDDGVKSPPCAHYNIVKQSMKTYNCLHCGKECIKKPSSRGKYCSNECQGEYQFANVTVPKIEAGECLEGKTLKRYMFKIGKCSCDLCGLGQEWNGKPLSLQLDHIDGNSDNCFPSNLRLLCPNCHTQTDTYGSKGNGNRYKKITKRNEYIRKYRGSEMDG